MATTPNSIITPQTLNTSFQTFATADTTTVKTIFTAGTNGSLVNSVIAQSTEGTARNIKLYITESAVDYPIGCVNVPITAGNTGAIASVNLLGSTLIPGLPLDSNGNPYLKLKSGQTLRGSMLVTANIVTVTAFGEDL